MTAAAPRNDPRGAREGSKQETREALVQAAMVEFAERGLDVPSLDAICARAGFTRGAFYVHFRDREELVAAVMERAVGILLDAVTAGGGDLAATIDRFVALASHGIEDVGRRGPRGAPALPAAVPFHQILAACQRAEGTRARMVAALSEAMHRTAATASADQRAGRVRADVSARDLASLLVLLALGVRAAADLRLPLDVASTRDAALRILGP